MIPAVDPTPTPATVLDATFVCRTADGRLFRHGDEIDTYVRRLEFDSCRS